MDPLFSEEDRQRIAEASDEAETDCVAEIVPYVVARSGGYSTASTGVQVCSRSAAPTPAPTTRTSLPAASVGAANGPDPILKPEEGLRLASL